MFGWFDRKHLGWLKRFMERTPVFLIPGSGRYLRQPYFANIITSCIQNENPGCYNISGLKKIDYVDLIRMIKSVTKSWTAIAHIPY
jgi:hypothetical protein